MMYIVAKLVSVTAPFSKTSDLDFSTLIRLAPVGGKVLLDMEYL